MGSTNYGTQTKSVGFYDPADSGVVNKRNVSVQERGIYSGGLLTMTSGNNVSLSPLVCVIGDANYQLRVETTVAVALTLDSTNKVVILRWSYTGSASTDYMDVLAVGTGSILPNDLIVGVGTFVGAALTGIEYNTTNYLRSEAKTAEHTLKVEASATPSMTLRVRSGNVNYGSTNLFVANQAVIIDAADSTFPRIDLVYVDTDGSVKKSKGTAAASPAANSYANKIVLAEVYVAAGVSILPQAVIKDVRMLIGNASSFSANFPDIVGSGNKYVKVNSGATAYEYQDISAAFKRVLFWYDPYPAVGTTVSSSFTLPWAGTIIKAYATVKTAPSGASILVDINKNGITIWSTQANRLAIASGTTSGTQTSFNTTAVAENDVITMDIDQVGSSVAGEQLSVELLVQTAG